MRNVSLSQFRAAVRGFDSHGFVTLAKKQPFVLHIDPSGLEFRLGSTGNHRHESWNGVAAVLERFNDSDSLKPGTYADVSRDASYVLSVLKSVLDGGAGERVTCPLLLVQSWRESKGMLIISAFAERRPPKAAEASQTPTRTPRGYAPRASGAVASSRSRSISSPSERGCNS